MKITNAALFYLFHHCFVNTRHAPDVLHEICEFESLDAECGQNEVIIMTHVLYGRMKLGRCIGANLGYLGCSVDVLGLADSACSGRRKCQLTANKEFKERQTCLKELRSYMEVSYTCQNVTAIDQSQCASCTHVTLSQPRGIIASQQSRDTRCGSPGCPWHISMATGQRINLTMVYFDWHSQEQTFYNGAMHTSQTCNDVIATVKESTNQKSRTICPGNQRNSHVYTSLSNTIDLRIMGGSDHYFLIKYEAVGCTDPIIPFGGYITRKGDTATVGCNNSAISYEITCVNDRWSREPDTCQTETGEATLGYVKLGNITLTLGFSITVIILLAVIISGLVLCLGIIIVKRRNTRSSENIYATTPYMDRSTYKDPPPPYPSGNTPRKHQQRRSKDNKSSYAHIWERPLPDKPEDTSTGMGTGTTGYESSYVQEPGSLYYGYSTIASVPRQNETSTCQVPEHFVARPGRFDNVPGRFDPVPGHFQGQTYGNNTLARRDILVSDTDDIEYPRYFQTRSDGNIKQSGESSHLTA